MHFIYQNNVSTCETPRTWTFEPLQHSRAKPRRGGRCAAAPAPARSISRCASSSISRIGATTRRSAPSPRSSPPPRPRSTGICRRWCSRASSTRITDTGNYEVGIKLVVLGEAARGRFDIVRAGPRRADRLARRNAAGRHGLRHGAGRAGRARPHPGPHRDRVRHAARHAARARCQRARQGLARLRLRRAIERSLRDPRAPPRTPAITRCRTSPRNRDARERGWATAPDEVIDGVNALAAPVFDHSGHMRRLDRHRRRDPIHRRRSRAATQIDAVVGAAQRISARARLESRALTS